MSDLFGRTPWPAMLLLAAGPLAVLAVYAPTPACALAIAVFAAVLIARDPDNALLIGLVALPFANSLLFANNIASIPGLKPVNAILAATFAIGFFKGGMFRSRDGVERRAKLFLLAYFLLFTFEFIRSLPNLGLFSGLLPNQFEGEPIRYILSFFVKNALLLVPFIYILAFMRDETDRVLGALALGIFLLSCLIVALVIMDPGVLGGGRNAIETLCERYIGFHYNTLGTIYLTVGPLLVYLARDRNLFALANLGLATLVILILQSRSALLVFVIASVVTLVLIRRKGFLVVGAVAVVLASGFWLGPTLSAVLSIGIDDGSVQSLDGLFTGRVEYLWLPLWSEWTSDPMLFLFGAGRYGILTSPLWKNGQILQAMHAHNAFLDFFLDAGAVLTLVLIGTIAWLLARGYRVGRVLRDPLYWSLFMCAVAYLAGTLTERQFFPAVDNMLLFPLLAVMLNVVRARYASVAGTRAERGFPGRPSARPAAVRL
jgi:hypothetical protein